jgi:hypothetical protein
MRIALKHGWCLLDDDDWHGAACMWTWRSARSTVRGTKGQRLQSAYVSGHPLDSYTSTQLEMHRFLLGLPPYSERRIDVDHINGNGLDNRRENLRVGTRAQNLANTGSRVGTSRFKGVSFCRRTGRWKAQITVDGRNQNLGRYDTQEEAALVYNVAAKQTWGEFAALNDIDASVNPIRKPRATSQYRGVSYDHHRHKWTAQIAVGSKNRHLGRFGTELEAAVAYNTAALEALGDKARLNAVEA